MSSDKKYSKENSEFDWEHVTMCGFQGKDTPMIPPDVARIPKIVKEMYVGNPPYDYLITFYIDGFKVESNQLNFNSRSRSFAVPNWKLDGICLNVKLDTETWQFINLENLLNQESIQRLRNWFDREKFRLMNIGTEFEKYERQVYHFMYEIIALLRATESLPNEKRDEIINDTKTAISLYHNRILAEVYSNYLRKGAFVELFLKSKENNRNADLKISEIKVEIKSILIAVNERKPLMNESASELINERKSLMKVFANKLRNEIIERESEKQQIGDSGTFFIGIWSGIISSILFAVFRHGTNDKFLKKKSFSFFEEIPPLNEKKAIIVLPTLNSFQNSYLVFERDEICDIMDYLASDGYEDIQEGKSMKYLVLTNIRKGCEFGVTGKHPVLIFKFR